MNREEQYKKDEQLISDYVQNNGGIVKAAEFAALGLDHRRVQQFVDDGLLRRIRNGHYCLVNDGADEDTIIYRMFGEDGILTMESALYVYGYIKTKPYEYQIAVDRNTSKSRFKLDYPFVHPYYTDAKALTLGVEEVDFGGGRMKIYDKERLVCEVLKYEEHMDRETVKQGLKSYIIEENQDKLKLLRYAKERRVYDKVMNRIGVWL